MTERESDKEQVIRMSGGLPGSLNVLLTLWGSGAGTVIDKMDANGWHGPDIWVAYKDYAKENLMVMAAAVLCEDEKLAKAVRRARR